MRHILEQVGPDVLGLGQDDRDELPLRIVGPPARRALRCRCRLRGRHVGIVLEQLDHVPGIGTQEQGDHDEENRAHAPPDGGHMRRW